MAHGIKFPAVSSLGPQLYECPKRLCVLQFARRELFPRSLSKSLEQPLSQVSWGTKGSDKAEALPSVSSKKTKDADAVVEDTTREQGDLDSQFKETVQRAVTKLVVKEVVEKPTLDDQNKTFRTRLVAVWMLSNAILAIAIQNINGIRNESDPNADEAALRSKQNFYFAVILYSTFFLSMVRFIGVSFLQIFSRSNGGLMKYFHLSVSVLLPQEEPVPMLQEELNDDVKNMGGRGSSALSNRWTLHYPLPISLVNIPLP